MTDADAAHLARMKGFSFSFVMYNEIKLVPVELVVLVVPPVLVTHLDCVVFVNCDVIVGLIF